MPFGMCGGVGDSRHVLDGGPEKLLDQHIEYNFIFVGLYWKSCSSALSICFITCAAMCLLQMTSAVVGFMMNAESESLSQSVESMSCSSQCDDAALTDGDAADINNAPCAVCLDTGSGFHYGVYTCEGCKVGLTSSDVNK